MNAGDPVELAFDTDGCFLGTHKEECCISLVTLLSRG